MRSLENERLVCTPGTAACLSVSVQPQGGPRRGSSALDSPASPSPAPPQSLLRPAASDSMAAPARTVKDVDPHLFVKEYSAYLRSTGKVRARADGTRTRQALPPARWHRAGWLQCAGWPPWAVAAPAPVIWAPAAGLQRGPLARGLRPRTAELARLPRPGCRYLLAQLLQRRPGARFRRWAGDGSQTLALPPDTPRPACLPPPRWRCPTGLTW